MKIQTLKQENIESYLNRASEYGSEYAASEEICHDLEHLEEAEQSDGGLFLSNSSGDHSACDASQRSAITLLAEQYCRDSLEQVDLAVDVADIYPVIVGDDSDDKDDDEMFPHDEALLPPDHIRVASDREEDEDEDDVLCDYEYYFSFCSTT
ncbi:hypothetical protein PInf_009623 [Phytophthora infestans]|nr:hypothetical protein PInf_009623 [Phytophthora infestans]